MLVNTIRKQVAELQGVCRELEKGQRTRERTDFLGGMDTEISKRKALIDPAEGSSEGDTAAFALFSHRLAFNFISQALVECYQI